MCFTGDIFGVGDPVRENWAPGGLKGLTEQTVENYLEATFVVEPDSVSECQCVGDGKIYCITCRFASWLS